MNLKPAGVDNIIKATCVLHNVLCLTTSAAAHYFPPGYAECQDILGNISEGMWRKEATFKGPLKRNKKVFFFFL